MGSDERGGGQQPGGEQAVTVRERLRGWVSEERVAMHLEGRAILLDGQIVTDLDRPAPPGARISFAGR